MANERSKGNAKMNSPKPNEQHHPENGTVAAAEAELKRLNGVLDPLFERMDEGIEKSKRGLAKARELATH
jgi:hypothetical protein